MRDHPYHGVALLGASWGTDLSRKVFGKRVSARQAWKESWKYILQDYLTYSKRESWGPDQKILTKYISKFQFKILPLTYTKVSRLYKKLAFIIILDMSGILGDGIMRFSMILIIVMCLIQVLSKDGQLNDVWNETILLQPLSEITK